MVNLFFKTKIPPTDNNLSNINFDDTAEISLVIFTAEESEWMLAVYCGVISLFLFPLNTRVKCHFLSVSGRKDVSMYHHPPPTSLCDHLTLDNIFYTDLRDKNNSPCFDPLHLF